MKLFAVSRLSKDYYSGTWIDKENFSEILKAHRELAFMVRAYSKVSLLV